MWAPLPLGPVVWDVYPVGPSQIGILDDTRAVTLFRNQTSSPVRVRCTRRRDFAVGAFGGRPFGRGSSGAVTRWTGTAPWNTVLQPWVTRRRKRHPHHRHQRHGSMGRRGRNPPARGRFDVAHGADACPDRWSHSEHVRARASNDVRVLGGDGVIHRWDGSDTWQTDTLPPADGPSGELRAISGSEYRTTSGSSAEIACSTRPTAPVGCAARPPMGTRNPR